VFKDALSSLYGTKLSETADDNGYDLNNLYNHRNVSALVWGSNWSLVPGSPTLVPFDAEDLCGADPKRVEALFFGDFEVVNVRTPAIHFHIITLQTQNGDPGTMVATPNGGTATTSNGGNPPTVGCIRENQGSTARMPVACPSP